MTVRHIEDDIVNNKSATFASFKCLRALTCEQMRKICIKLWTPYLTSGSKILKLFKLLLISLVSKIYVNFKFITWSVSQMLVLEIQENEKLFANYWELTSLFTVWIIFSDTLRETLLTSIGLKLIFC